MVATKPMTLRLGETTLHQLNYLMWVSRAKSQAEVVRTVVGLVAEAVAAAGDPDDPEQFYQGGTVLTAAEQQTYRQLVETLQAFTHLDPGQTPGR
jgi:hypothetical protein